MIFVGFGVAHGAVFGGKIVPKSIKIEKKCLPKFDLKFDCIFDRFLIDFDSQNGGQMEA